MTTNNWERFLSDYNKPPADISPRSEGDVKRDLRRAASDALMRGTETEPATEPIHPIHRPPINLKPIHPIHRPPIKPLLTVRDEFGEFAAFTEAPPLVRKPPDQRTFQQSDQDKIDEILEGKTVFDLDMPPEQARRIQNRMSTLPPALQPIAIRQYETGERGIGLGTALGVLGQRIHASEQASFGAALAGIAIYQRNLPEFLKFDSAFTRKMDEFADLYDAAEGDFWQKARTAEIEIELPWGVKGAGEAIVNLENLLPVPIIDTLASAGIKLGVGYTGRPLGLLLASAVRKGQAIKPILDRILPDIPVVYALDEVPKKLPKGKGQKKPTAKEIAAHRKKLDEKKKAKKTDVKLGPPGTTPPSNFGGTRITAKSAAPPPQSQPHWSYEQVSKAIRAEAAKVAPDKPPIKTQINNFYIWAQKQVTDRGVEINNLTKRAKREWVKENNAPFPLELDAEVQLSLMGGVFHAPKSYSDDVLQAVRRGLGKAISTEDLNNYLYLRHEQWVLQKHPKRKLPPNLKSANEIPKTINDLKEKLGPTLFVQLEETANIVTRFFHDMLDRRIKSGMHKPEVGENLKEMYPYYVPTGYIVPEGVGITDPFKVQSRSSLTNIPSESKIQMFTETGKDEARINALDHIAKAAIHTELLVRKNDLVKAIIKDIGLDPTNRIKIIEAKRVKGKLPTGKAKRFAKRPEGTKGMAELSYMEAGEEVKYYVPQWLAKELEMISQLGLPGNTRFIEIAQNVFRMPFTSHNPVFWAANYVFDAITVMSIRGVTPWKLTKATFKTVKALFTSDDTLKDLYRAGGGISGFQGRTRGAVIKDIQDQGNLVLHDQLSWDLLFKTKTGVLRTIEMIGGSLEMAPRLAVYMAERDRGTDAARAALAARRATVDFQRTGQALRIANTVFLYLNAGVQGSLLPLRAARDSARARMGLAGIVAVSEALYWWNQQFPEYQDLSTRDKYSTMGVMLPSHEIDPVTGRVKPHYIAIVPMLREFSLFTAPLLYLTAKLHAMAKETPEMAPESMGEFFKAMAPEWNPFSRFTGQGGLPIPLTAGETVIELAMNRDQFRGQPIVPPHLEKLPKEQQYDANTSELAKRVGSYIPLAGISPMKLDHLMKMGMWRELVLSVDAIINKVDSPTEDPLVLKAVAKLQELDERWDIKPTNPNLEDLLSARKVTEKDIIAGLDKKQTLRVRELIAEEKAQDIPFLDSLQRRFYKDHGGQLYRSGLDAAAKGNPDISIEQTKELSIRLDHVALDAKQSQLAIDAEAQAGKMTKAQWLDGRSNIGAEYRTAMTVFKAILPQAAQVQSPDEWTQYRKSIYTIGGKIKDTRLKIDVLKAAYFGIPQPEPESEGKLFNAQLDQFFNRRKEFLEGLDVKDKKALIDDIRASASDMEKEYYKDQDTMQKYWDISDTVLSTYPERVRQDYLEWRNLQGRYQNEFLQHPSRGSLQRAVEKIQDDRERMRYFDKDVDIALAFWYGRVFKNPSNLRSLTGRGSWYGDAYYRKR